MTEPIWITIKLIRGVEGDAIYFNNTRLAGPKPWGGGDLVSELVIPLGAIEELLARIEQAREALAEEEA